MTCAEFDRLLDDALAGTLPAAAEQELDRHRAACARCRELQAIVSDSGVLAESEAAPDVAAAVLARTTGPACGRARELAAAGWGAPGEGADGELVRLHLASCGGCRTVTGAMSWIGASLPALAEADPGPGFAGAVAGRTERLRAWRRRGAAARGWWGGLMLRPRFAWEAAYVGVFVLVLVVGIPGSPLQSAPERLLALARVNPVEASVGPASEVKGKLVRLGGQVWDATGGEVFGGREPAEKGFWYRVRRVAAETRTLFGNGTSMCWSVLQGDLDAAGERLGGMKENVKTMWLVIVSQDDPETDRTLET